MLILDALDNFDYLWTSKANAGKPRFNAEVRNNDREEFDDLPDFSDYYTNPRGLDSTDILFGSPRTDAFKFNFTLWGTKAARDMATHSNGELDKKWLGGINDHYHSHYAESIGNDYLVNFSSSDGDVIVLDGHAVAWTVLYSDETYTRLGIYSDHGNDRFYYSGTAHDGDVLGTVNIIGDFDPSSVYTVDTFV